MSNKNPLEGLLVVSLEQAVAAPMASRRLADAGARVIKLERPEGDFGRNYDKAAKGQSSYFVWLNRGKESVTVDMTKRADLDLFEALLAKADVFIQNLKPGSLGRLGYSFEDLRKRFPKLVICSISGYGESGPYAHRKAYDLLIQAEAGLAFITGTPDSPGRVGVSIVDLSTGNNAYEAILEALLSRAKTGEGCDIRVSMFDTVAEWMAVPMTHGDNGNPPPRVGLSHPSIAPYGTFQTRDGDGILISIQSEREWAVLARDVMQRPDLITDPKFATNNVRVERRAETDRIIQECFGAHSTTEMTALLDKYDIAFGQVSDVPALLKHPHLRRMPVETPNGAIDMPCPAAQVVGEPRSFGSVPPIGSHDDAVRREFLSGSAASG